MKKILSLALVLLTVVLVFSGCGAKPATTSPDPKEDDAGKGKQEKPVLTMATTADFRPFEYIEGNKFVGADIDLAYAICEKLGYELEITNVSDFEAMLSHVAEGKYDIAVSEITSNEERQKNLDFTVPYYRGSLVAIVAAESEIYTVADLREKIISCQRGTTGEKYIIDHGYAPQSYKTGEEAFSALISEKVDAVVIDDAVARTLSEKQSETVRILDEPLAEEEYAIALKSGNNELTEKINGAIKELKEDGTLAKILGKYKLVLSE